MKPVELEIIMRDSTRQGMQSAVGNVEELNQRIEKQNALIKQLEGDLRTMQVAFEKASRAGDQTENIAMVAALKKEVAALKGEWVELEKQQKKTASTAVTVPAAAPSVTSVIPAVASLGLKEQKEELKANIKFMEDYVKQYEKSMKGMAPGKEKAMMTQELEGSKAALLAEKEALVQLEAQMGSAGQKQVMLRTQIANLKQEMAGMTEGTDKYNAAMLRLGEMQDQYSDISTQGRIFADDNKNIRATMDAVSGLSGAMAAGVGVASLFGMEEEKLAQIQTKLQAVMAITMGVQQVANTLNKDSYFTHVLLAKGKVMLTAANTRLAISLGISTVAAKALMATLTLGVSVAIGALILLWDRYNGKQEEAQKAQEAAVEAAKQLAEAENELRKSAAGSVSAQLLGYKQLQAAYRELGDDMKKKVQFVKDNRKAFDELGISVAGVKDAENLLIDGEEAFLRTMNNRALIAASMELAAEKYKEAIAKMMEVDAKQKKAGSYSAKDLDADDRTVAGRIAAEKVHQLRGGNFLEGVADEDMEAKLNEYAKTGNKFYTKALAIYNKEKERAIEKVTRQNKGALERNAEEERKNIAKFMNEGAESIRNSTKLTQENKDIFSLAGFVPTKDDKSGNSKDTTMDHIAAAELKARQKIEAMKMAIMQEGAAKEKAEARLHFDAELARIDAEEKERLAALVKAKKKGLPVNKEQVDAVTDQSAQQRKGATDIYVKEFVGIEKEYGDKQKKEFDALLAKYQDYTARRVGIEKRFNDDIAILQAERDAAQQKGDTGKVDQMNRAIAQATTNKGKELIGLDYEQLKQMPDYIRAFENLKETSSDTLDSLLAQLENAKSAAAEVLSPDQLREYTTTIQEIMDELDSRNPFGALADRKKELAEAEAELATARQQLNAVQGDGKIVTGVKNTKFNDKTGKIESEKSYLTTTKAMENYNKAQDNVTKKGAKVKKAEKEVKDVMDDLFDSIKDVGDAIGGPAGEIISLIGDIGLFAMTAMSGVSTASETASKSIQAVEKASVILAIIGAAIQIAMKIASLFKDDDGVAAYEKAKDVYESYIDILDRVIEKQKELFELNSKTGEQAYEKAKETVKLQEDASRELGKQYLNSGASKGFLGIGSSASEGVKQKDGMSWKAQEEAKKALGQSGYNKVMDGRMTGLFDLSAKQLADLQGKAPLFWAELHDDTRTYLEQIIACADELKQIEDDRKEGLTKIDFESFYSGFLDTLSDMDASSEDFANSFEDYLKNAILSSLITNEYKTRIQALYDNWASYTKSGEKLTEQEVEALRKEQEAISEEMLRKREELAKTFGWQSEADKEQQSGKAGAFATITQDQGTKLEGLFTSVQGHVSNMDDLLKDIAMAMYEASDTLLRIEANTAYCKYLEQLAEDIAELKRDGIKMK